MTHLDEGALRAHLDGQLDALGARHLEQCAECRARFAEMVSRSSVIQGRLKALDNTPAAPRPAALLPARAAGYRFETKRRYSAGGTGNQVSFRHDAIVPPVVSRHVPVSL